MTDNDIRYAIDDTLTDEIFDICEDCLRRTEAVILKTWFS